MKILVLLSTRHTVCRLFALFFMFCAIFGQLYQPIYLQLILAPIIRIFNYEKRSTVYHSASIKPRNLLIATAVHHNEYMHF